MLLPRSPSADHPERPERVAVALEERLTACGLVARCAALPRRVAADDELALVHGREYIAQVAAAADAVAAAPDDKARRAARAPSLSPRHCVRRVVSSMSLMRSRSCASATWPQIRSAPSQEIGRMMARWRREREFARSIRLSAPGDALCDRDARCARR